jgi:hypothetical protein
MILRNFIPKWTKAVKYITKSGCYSEERRNKIENKLRIEWINGGLCMVGEAHNFNPDYSYSLASPDKYCNICQFLSRGPSYDSMLNGGITFQAFKIVLFRHMKKVHWK